MQTQLFLPQKGAEQRTPLISGVPFGAQGDIDATPFAEFVQHLTDAPTSGLVEISTTPEDQATAQDKHGVDETDLPTVEPEDKNPPAHLTIEDGGKTTSTADGNFFDHDAEQQRNGPKGAARDLQFPVTMATITTQGQASEQPDVVTVPNPVELALLSQKLPVQSDKKGRLENAVRSDHASDSVALQREPLRHHLPLKKPSEAINPLALPVPAKPLTLSTRAEQIQLISKPDVTDQYSTSETVKLAHYAINVTPAAALNDGKKLDPNVLLDHTKDVFELRTNTLIETRSTTYVPPSHTVNRSDFASPVTRQIVDAIQARVTADKVIEVSLNPAELGRLKLSLTPAENGLVINVMAERAETIEMIRRNLTDLEQAFSDMGHENITFSFDQNGDFEDHTEQQDSKFHSDGIDGSDHMASKSAPSIQDPRDLIITSGIDIRV
jgi:hypothetical protein